MGCKPRFDTATTLADQRAGRRGRVRLHIGCQAWYLLLGLFGSTIQLFVSVTAVPKIIQMETVYYEGNELEALANMSNYYAWIFDIFAPWARGDIIEYGAGLGTVSERLVPLADRLTLVEPSVQLADALRIRFAGNRWVEIEAESLEIHVARTEAHSADTVVLVNVLEHIEDDRAALAHIFRILKPGGHLLIFVPALGFLMSKFDLMLGHFRRYHRRDLMGKVTESGGEVLVCRYFDLAGIIPWWVAYTLMGARRVSPTLLRIGDKVLIPVSRAIERIFPAPIGKNLILIAEKPIS